MRTIWQFRALSAGFLFFALLGTPLHSAAQCDRGFCIGAVYEKENDKPASLALLKTEDDWLWRIDGVAYYRWGLGPLISDMGLAITTGSAVKEKARVFNPILAFNSDFSGIYWDASFQYETTSQSDYRKSLFGLRVSPLNAPAVGIGVPLGRNPEFRWRPYIGAQLGRALEEADPVEVSAGEHSIIRVTGSLETFFRVKESSAPTAATLVEFTTRTAGWYLASNEELKSQFSAGVALPVNSTIWVQLKYDRSEKPPAFVRDESVTLSVGVKR